MRVVWAPSALREVQLIYRYVADLNPGAAAALARALIAQGESLALFPHRGRPVGDGLREVTPIYPYIIRYQVTGEVVEIVRVRHGMRRG